MWQALLWLLWLLLRCQGHLQLILKEKHIFPQFLRTFFYFFINYGMKKFSHKWKGVNFDDSLSLANCADFFISSERNISNDLANYSQFYNHYYFTYKPRKESNEIPFQCLHSVEWFFLYEAKSTLRTIPSLNTILKGICS